MKVILIYSLKRKHIIEYFLVMNDIKKIKTSNIEIRLNNKNIVIPNWTKDLKRCHGILDYVGHPILKDFNVWAIPKKNRKL